MGHHYTAEWGKAVEMENANINSASETEPQRLYYNVLWDCAEMCNKHSECLGFVDNHDPELEATAMMPFCVFKRSATLGKYGKSYKDFYAKHSSCDDARTWLQDFGDLQGARI